MWNYLLATLKDLRQLLIEHGGACLAITLVCYALCYLASLEFGDTFAGLVSDELALKISLPLAVPLVMQPLLPGTNYVPLRLPSMPSVIRGCS